MDESLFLLVSMLFALIFAMIYYVYYILAIVEEPAVIFSEDNDFCKLIISKIPALNQSFFPNPLLPSGHLQTIVPTVLRGSPNFPYTRETLDLNDGGAVALDWFVPNQDHVQSLTIEKAKAVIVILHGLTGGSHESYVRQFIASSKNAGYVCVVFNFRGASNTKLKSPITYAATATGDTSSVMKHVRSKVKSDLSIYAVGYSLGANILAKYLGEEGEKTPVSAAFVVSNPWDLVEGSRFLDSRFIQREFYSRVLANAVKRYVRTHLDVLSKNTSSVDMQSVLNARTLRQFDDLGTRKLHGFKSVDQYYYVGSSVRYLKNVSIPLLSLNSISDPLFHEACIPYRETRENPNVMLVVTESGGHVSFVEGLSFSHSFMERLGVQFFDAITNIHQSEVDILK